MAATTVNLIQSGSASATLHVQTGDTVTVKLLNNNHNPQLAEAVKGLQLLTAITGVTFTATTGGGAS